jgi:hypothetical protein
VVGVDDDGDPVPIGHGLLGRFAAHGLGGQVDQGSHPQLGGGGADGRVAVAGGPQLAVDVSLQRGVDQLARLGAQVGVEP